MYKVNVISIRRRHCLIENHPNQKDGDDLGDKHDDGKNFVNNRYVEYLFFIIQRQLDVVSGLKKICDLIISSKNKDRINDDYCTNR